MNDIIPKNIFMIWLGDNVPDYVKFSADAYAKANPAFNVQLIHFTLMQLEDIYRKENTVGIEQVLHKSMQVVLQKSNLPKDNIYVKLLAHQKQLYGSSVRFVQILSDIFRLMLVSTFGGIYVDCDTFPMKPFDDALLQMQQFTVARHYDNDAKLINKNIGIDNYFFGSVASKKLEITTQLLQTKNKWWIDIQYMLNKKKFYNLELKYTQKCNQPFYVEHYYDGNWKMVNGKIRTQLCSLDDNFRL